MIRLFKRFLAPVAVAIALAAPFGASAQTQAAPLKFNWGIPSADYYAVYVAREIGLFKEAGLDPEFFIFASGAPLLAGLKSGSLDVILAEDRDRFARMFNLTGLSIE